jgi:tetratricopeptide (TPR) repeat protein
MHGNGRGGSGSSDGSGRRLIGWKAIGQFLGCTERTARRWETERALPVHRIPGSGRRSVWVHAEELSAWLNTLPADAKASLRAEQELEQQARPHPDPVEESPAQAAAAPDAAVPDPQPPVPALRPATPPAGRWASWRVSAVAAGVLLLGAAAWVYFTRGATGSGPQSAGTGYEDNPAALATYMNARFELSTRSADGLGSAERGFRQLVERYPERPAAWSGLAETYMLLREFGSMPDKVAYPQAARAARAAIALDPRASTAWLDLAFITWWWQGDSAKAAEEFETALRLDPNSARAHHWYATALSSRGEFPRALEQIERARALNPDNPAIVADEAYIRYGAGGPPNEAIASLLRLTQLDPGFESPHFYLSRIYLHVGRDTDFLHEAATAAQLRQQDDVRAELGLAEEKLHSGGRAAMLEQLSQSEAARWADGKGSAVFVAEYRALAHDHVGMLRWLAIAAEGHDNNLPALYALPEFSPYLKDADFVAIVNRPK